MINKAQIIIAAKRIVHHQSGLSDRQHQLMYPSRDWMIGLTIAALILFGTVVLSSATFMNYKSLTIDQSQQTEETATVYRSSMVETALEIFAEKQRVFTELNSGSIRVAETSPAQESVEESIVDVPEESPIEVAASSSEVQPEESVVTNEESSESEVETDVTESTQETNSEPIELIN